MGAKDWQAIIAQRFAHDPKGFALEFEPATSTHYSTRINLTTLRRALVSNICNTPTPATATTTTKPTTITMPRVAGCI